MNVADDLARIATDALGIREILNANNPALDRLRQSIDTATRAWSGSNLGYHACVYFGELIAPPASVQFSPEWGLMDRWPTHQPHPGWRLMDYEDVRNTVISSAGDLDIKTTESGIVGAGKALSNLKERAISVLSMQLAQTKDSYFKRKLAQVETIEAGDATVLARSQIRKIDWSRDSMAVTQGARLAPHQSLQGVVLAARKNAKGLEMIADICQQASEHAWRLAGGDIRFRPADMATAIPASDRIVPIDHNSGQTKILIENLDNLAKAVERTNDFPLDDDKSQRLNELTAGKTLLQATKVRVLAVWSVLAPTLLWFIDKFSGGLVSQLAAAAISLLRAILGI
jgi:hypothetical protein